MTNGNDERLQVEAWLALEGLRPDVAKALIAALRSNEELQPAFRAKIAAALERRHDERGIRLEVRGGGSGGKENIGSQIRTRRRWMIAGRRIGELAGNGVTVEEAKHRVMSLMDVDGSTFGYNASQAAQAWSYYQQFLAFRTSRKGDTIAKMFTGTGAEHVDQLLESWFHEDAKHNPPCNKLSSTRMKSSG